MKPKQRRILLLVALLLVFLAMLAGRWLLSSTPELTEVTHVEPVRNLPATETKLEQPPLPFADALSLSQEPRNEKLEPAPAKKNDSAGANVSLPTAEAPKPEAILPISDNLVVTYGVQVFVAATIDDHTLSIDGEDRDSLPRSGEYLAVERNLFVSEQSLAGHDLDPDAVVRGYTVGGIDAGFGWLSETTDRNGNILEQHHSGPERAEFVSNLLGVRARKGPTGSIVVLDAEREREIPGALWDLGLSIFLPPGHVVSGSNWIVPAASLAHVLSPGSDLLLRIAPEAFEELVAITPGGAPTQAQLGAWSGDSIATYEGTKMVGSRERHSARIAIDATSKSEDVTLGQLFLEHLLRKGLEDHPEFKLESKGTAKLDFSCTGTGVVAWCDDDVRPPVSEIRCTFTATVELRLDVKIGKSSTPIDCTYRIHGQLAYLAGMPARDGDYWSQMWQPREVFLARESFTIR